MATGLALGLAALAAASWWRPVALDPTGVEVVVGPGALAVRWAADGPAQGAVEVEDVASGAWRRVPVADVPVVSGRRQVLVEEVTPGARVRVSLEAAGLKLDLGEVRAGRAWAQASPTPVVEVEGRRWLDLQLGEGVRGASTRLLLAGPGADLEAPATLDLEDALGRQRAWSLRPAEVLREAARAFLDRCPRDHLEDLLALSKASAIDGLINDAANSIGIRTQGARTGLDRVRESLTPDGKNMAKTRAKMDAALQGRVWVRDYRRLRLALAEYLGRVRDDPAVHERVRARWGLVQRVARAYEMVAGGACLAVPTLERPAVEALPRLLGADLGRRTLRSPSARTFDVSYPASHFSRQVALPGDIPNGDLVVEVEMRFLTRQQALEVSLGGPPGVLLFPRGLGEGVTAESGTVRFRLPGAWRPAGPAVVHLSLRNVFDLRDPVPIEVDALRVYPAVGAAGPARLVGGDRGVFAAASEAR